MQLRLAVVFLALVVLLVLIVVSQFPSYVVEPPKPRATLTPGQTLTILGRPK